MKLGRRALKYSRKREGGVTAVAVAGKCKSLIEPRKYDAAIYSEIGGRRQARRLILPVPNQNFRRQ
jgi:hypothetical protein